jgi:arylsulfatase A-like enzyme
MTSITRRSLLQAAAAAPWLGRLLDPGSQVRRRPNLLLIVADDLGYGDLSSFGRPDYRTPNLDRLGASGVRFTEAYSSASTCTPTRVAMMTGRWPARLPDSMQKPMSFVNDKDGLPPGIPTTASVLKAAGYRTTLVGKWHLGYLPEFGPERHGFDEFFGYLSGGIDYWSHATPSGQLDLREGSEPVTRIGYSTNLFTDRAIEVIRRQGPEPFFLSLQYNAPHWPWEGPEDSHSRTDSLPHAFMDGGSRAIYAKMVTSLDAGIGRLIAALDRSGKAANTLVIFTSDNGGERYSYNWPFSENKWTLWEGGIRVPAIARWPGVIPARSTSLQTLQTMDWAPTLFAAAGVPAASWPPLDGVDLLPMARGGPATERTLFWRQPAQRGDLAAMRAARRGRWKYLKIADKESLFDLSVDSGEKADLKASQPEVFRDLATRTEAWEREVSPPPA